MKADVQFSSAEQTKVCYGAEGRFINNAPVRDIKRSVGHWLFLVIPETSGLGINDLRDKEIKILKVDLTDKSTPFNSMHFRLGNYGDYNSG